MQHPPFATVLVGPSGLLREGLARILEAADFRVVASTTCLDDAVLGTLAKYQSILLIIDAGDDPGGIAGYIELFKKQHPAGRVAVLSDHYRPSEIVPAFRAGANAYFPSVAACDALIKYLELVMLGETILPPSILPIILDHKVDDLREATARDVGRAPEVMIEAEGQKPQLSIRELCILRFLVEGDSNKVIARKVKIAEATVKVHVKAILRKIRVHNRTQAAIWAMNNGSFVWTMANGAAPTRAVAALSGSETQTSAALLPAPTEYREGPNHVALASIDRLVHKKSVAA
jgi:two-component system nitrate/nitrite response regulator NarL